MKPQAYSYIRMSTAEQLGGDSLRRQVKLSEDYAREHDLELVPENRMQDIGRSAYSGEHITHGAFGAFLKQVKSGAIPSGSYLLVESLDRLSRLSLIEAMQLFLDIIKSGIVLVTLFDKREYRKENFDQISLMSSIVYLIRANEESQTKSRRVGEAWEKKRLRLSEPTKNDTESGPTPKPYTSKCPAWLRMRTDGKRFEFIPERVEVVRRIFALAVEGQGAFTITRHLNASKTPPMGRSGKWHKSYVTKILTNRACYGEFQPHRMEAGRRTPDGIAHADYFPAAVTKEVFVAAQAGRKQRITSGRGRKGINYANLFSGIARCAYCNASMYFMDKGEGPKGGKYLQCAGALEGRGCSAKTWRYADFEASFFSFVSEIDLRQLLSAASSQNRRVKLLNDLRRQEELRASLVDEQGRAWTMQQKKRIAYLDQRLEDLQGQIDVIDADIESLRAELAGPSEPSPQLDPEGVRQALFDATGGTADQLRDRRFKIANEIRRLVVRLELGPSGKVYEVIWKLDNWDKAKDGDPPDIRDRVMTKMGGYAQQTSPFFRVALRDGTDREVVIDAKDPHKLLLNWELDPTREFFTAHRPS